MKRRLGSFTKSLFLSSMLIAGLFSVIPGAFAFVGDKAEDFSLQDVNGKTVSLSGFKGKVVILNFWATWCPPCRMEMPHFVELYNEKSKNGLAILGVSVDRGGLPTVKGWLAKNPISYPILMADGDVQMTYQNYLATEDQGGIPYTFVIDKKGVIRHQLVGYRDKATWQSLVEPLLKEK